MLCYVVFAVGEWQLSRKSIRFPPGMQGHKEWITVQTALDRLKSRLRGFDSQIPQRLAKASQKVWSTEPGRLQHLIWNQFTSGLHIYIYIYISALALYYCSAVLSASVQSVNLLTLQFRTVFSCWVCVAGICIHGDVKTHQRRPQVYRFDQSEALAS